MTLHNSMFRLKRLLGNTAISTEVFLLLIFIKYFVDKDRTTCCKLLITVSDNL